MAELIVITGGAHAGKTSVIAELAARGLETVPEAALEVIRELNDAMGVERQIAWRGANLSAFQDRVSRRQHAREAAARRSPSTRMFCDRGLLDGLAYCRMAGIDWPRDLHELAEASRYEHVFLLETLSTFEPRHETGRIDDREESLRVAGVLEELYRPRTDRLTRVEEAAVADRVDLMLSTLGLG